MTTTLKSISYFTTYKNQLPTLDGWRARQAFIVYNDIRYVHNTFSFVVWLCMRREQKRKLHMSNSLTIVQNSITMITMAFCTLSKPPILFLFNYSSFFILFLVVWQFDVQAHIYSSNEKNKTTLSLRNHSIGRPIFTTLSTVWLICISN